MMNNIDNVSFDRIIHLLSINDYINMSLTSMTIRKRTSRYKKMKSPYIYLHDGFDKFIRKETLTLRGKELLLDIDPNVFDKFPYGLHHNHDLIRIALKYGTETIFKYCTIIRVVPLGFKKGVDPEAYDMQRGLNAFKSFQKLCKKRESLIRYIGGFEFYFSDFADSLNKKLHH